MNYAEIEKLKSILMDMVRHGCSIKIPGQGIEGRVFGVGFRPYWTYLSDSKIDKLEFNIEDSFGRVFPFSFNYVIGYEDITSKEGINREDSKNAILDIIVYSPGKARGNDPCKKIRLEIASEKEM